MRDESFVITFLSTTTRTTRTTAEIPRWCDEIENLTVVGESPNLKTRGARACTCCLWLDIGLKANERSHSPSQWKAHEIHLGSLGQSCHCLKSLLICGELSLFFGKAVHDTRAERDVIKHRSDFNSKYERKTSSHLMVAPR